MAATEIWTYQDIVEHLLDVFDSSRAGRPLRLAKRAAIEALRELCTAHRWLYYETTRVIRTEASYTTGTIAYDHTGGTYERLVTLSDGTLPDNTRYYRIILDGVHYPVDYVVDSTNLLLSADENPGADLAAGTAYTLYRAAYPLPVGFVEMGELWDIDDEVRIPIVLSDVEHREAIYWYEDPDEPFQATIRNDGEFLNSLSLVFSPPPSAAKNYSLIYHRSPRPLVTEKYSTGTVTVGAGSASCAITTGSFATAHIGCIIRFGDASNEPDNVFGGLSDTQNPFVAERTIVAVASDGTSCTLDSVLSEAATAVKFTVSDPLDVEHTAMLTAYQRLAEAAYTRLSKRELKDRREREELALFALRAAKERDSRSPYAVGPSTYDPFTRANVSDDET